MAGTRLGGKKAAATNKLKYGEDFFRIISRKGGEVRGVKKGFATDKVGEDGLTGRQRASKAGAMGGKASRKLKLTEEQRAEIKAQRGQRKAMALAREYGVSDSLIYQIWGRA